MRQLLTLPNGLRVALVPNAQSFFAGLAVIIEAGSRFLRAEDTVHPHVIEHMMTAECQRYPTYEALMRQLDLATTDFEAESPKEGICFKFEARRSRFEACLDLAAEVVLRPQFRELRLQRELALLADEYETLDTSAEVRAADACEERLFGDHPLGASGSGTMTWFQRATVSDLYRWHAENVCGRRLVIVVSGNFDDATTLARLKRLFGSLPPGTPAQPVPLSDIRPGTVVLSPESNHGLVQIAIAFPTAGFGQRDRLALSILNNHLGGSTRNSSRLFLTFRDEGLAYEVESRVWHYRDAGTLTILTVVRTPNLLPALATIRRELELLRERPLSADELWLAKRSLKDEARGRHTDCFNGAAFFAFQLLLTGRLLTCDQYVKAINLVWSAEVFRVARSILSPPRLTAVLIGELDGHRPESITDALGLEGVETMKGGYDASPPTAA